MLASSLLVKTSTTNLLVSLFLSLFFCSSADKWFIQSLLNLLAVAEAIFIITGAVKDICGKPPTERVFLDKYGRICLCLDEIVWNGLLENTDKDRIKRLIRLKPPSEFWFTPSSTNHTLQCVFFSHTINWVSVVESLLSIKILYC